MNKKYFLLNTCLMSFIFVTLINHSATFAFNSSNQPSMDGDANYVSIQLDNVALNLATRPIRLNKAVLVPAQSFLTALGVQVYWIEDSKEILGYRDNTFIKFKLNSNVAYVNGKPFELPLPVMSRYSEAFVPLDFIVSAFELTYNETNSKHLISLDFRENIYQYQTFDYRSYKKVSTTNWGISFYIPEYWEKIEGSFATYGVSNDYENYSIEPNVISLPIPSTKSVILKNQVNTLTYTHGEDIIFGEKSIVNLNEIDAYMQTYQITEEDIVTNGVLYVFYENGIAYTFNCNYDDEFSRSEGLAVFNTIMNTFQISKITLDESTEHYIELEKFFDYDMQIESPLYSNITTDTVLPFKGTVKSGTSLKGLHVLIEKEQELMEIYVPIVDDAFDAMLPLPFGLGKHSLRIYVDDEAPIEVTEQISNLTLDEYINKITTDEVSFDLIDLALETSVVNLSDDETLYLLSTNYVNYNNKNIYTLVNGITYNLSSDYTKAKALYTWLAENYEYRENQKLATTVDLLNESGGNEAELSILYTGLLRSLNIPARIVKGTANNDSRYWTEIYLNGSWLVADIASEIQYPDDLPYKYFNLNHNIHYSQFEKTEYLPF